MIRFDATGRHPVDKWTAAPRPTTCPQGQKPQQKRSNHMVHKPVNSPVCYRQVCRSIPQLRAAAARSDPSITNAIANILRAAFASVDLAADARRSLADKSNRVTATVMGLSCL